MMYNRLPWWFGADEVPPDPTSQKDRYFWREGACFGIELWMIREDGSGKYVHVNGDMGVVDPGYFPAGEYLDADFAEIGEARFNTITRQIIDANKGTRCATCIFAPEEKK